MGSNRLCFIFHRNSKNNRTLLRFLENEEKNLMKNVHLHSIATKWPILSYSVFLPFHTRTSVTFESGVRILLSEFKWESLINLFRLSVVWPDSFFPLSTNINHCINVRCRKNVPYGTWSMKNVIVVLSSHPPPLSGPSNKSPISYDAENVLYLFRFWVSSVAKVKGY